MAYKKLCFISFFLVISNLTFGQTTVKGKVLTFLDDGQTPPDKILVKNLNMGVQWTIQPNKLFEFQVNLGDSIQISADFFENEDFVVGSELVKSKEYVVTLYPEIIQIQMTQAGFSGLSKYLDENVKNSRYQDSIANLYANMGIKIKEKKPRESLPDTAKLKAKDYIPLPFTLNVTKIFKEISGEGRRDRNLYKFAGKDQAYNGILDYFGLAYFTEDLKIPEDFVYDFIKNTDQKSGVQLKFKKKFITQIQDDLEKNAPIFLKLLSENMKK